MKATNTQLIDVFSTCSFNYCYSSLQNKTYSIIHGILHGEPVSFDVSAFYRFTSTLYFYSGQATSFLLMTRPVVEFIKKQFCVSDPCISGRYVTSRLVTSASVSLSLSPSIKSAVCVTSRNDGFKSSYLLHSIALTKG